MATSGTPGSSLLHRCRLGHGVVQPEPARRDERDVRGVRAGLVPGRRDAAPAVDPRERLPARAAHHRRHPVPGQEGRVDPLEREDPGPLPVLHGLVDGVQALLQLGDQRLARRRAVRGAGHGGDRVEDLVEGVGVDGQHGRVEVEGVERLGHRRRGQRADAAEVLGEDEVGRGVPQGLAVERVLRQPLRRPLADRRVDLRGREARREGGVDDDRARGPDGLGPVALERHGHEVVGETQRADDLRGRRQQRGDPHVARPYVSEVPGYSRELRSRWAGQPSSGRGSKTARMRVTRPSTTCAQLTVSIGASVAVVCRS